MAVYSPSRRRAILLLLLTSALLLTLDMRGSAVLDTGRSLFSSALRPFESAAEVVTRPVKNAWRGITDYHDLERRYDELSARYDAMRADHYVARAVIAQNRDLKAQLDMPVPERYAVTTAYVIGERPTNIDHVIQIDKGSNSNICVGMPVLANGWLIGRVSNVDAERSWVRLATDARFGISAMVRRPDSIEPGQLPAAVLPVATDPPPGTVGPDGSLPPDTTAAPLDTLPPDGGEPVGDAAGDAAPPTTLAAPIRSTGLFQGRGGDLLPVVRFQDGLPSNQLPQVGDVVFTTGGELSLAPVDVPIGVVVSSSQGTTSEGLLTEVQLQVDLHNLEFVQVMLYVPQQEAGRCASAAALGLGT